MRNPTTMSKVLHKVRNVTSAFSRRAGNMALSTLSWIVFAELDIADQFLCLVFAFLDFCLDSEKRVCYCWVDDIQNGDKASAISTNSPPHEGAAAFAGHHCPTERWTRSSDSLYARVRRSLRTGFHILTFQRSLSSCADDKNSVLQIIPSKGVAELIPNEADGTVLLPEADRCASKRRVIVPNANSHLRSLTERNVNSVRSSHKPFKEAVRWSDCGCQRCTSWQLDEDQHLYVHVDDKDFVASIGNQLNAVEIAAENNVIFLHGFLSSSSFWVDTVLPALPESVRTSNRLFAVDIMGFGRSPKPSNSLYTIADHVDMIRRSVLEPYGIQSFHLVAHSMGCTIALALAAHYPSAMKSITLIAPPYFPEISKDSSSTYIMEQIAARRIWPLMTFCSSVMSWYEHVGRLVCFVVCKHHRLWDPLLLFVHSFLGKRTPSSCVTAFTQHTHHSAWHIFHNTICNGAYAADHCIEILMTAGKRVNVLHGTRDAVIPIKSSISLCKRHPNAHLTEITSVDHTTIVFGREAELVGEIAEEILQAPGVGSMTA